MSDVDGDEVADDILSVYELTKIADYLDDDDVRWALVKLTKIISNPHIPSNTVVPLMVKFQGLSMRFNQQEKYYMFKGKGEPEASIKKNYYKSLSYQLEKLVDVLKYVAKM